MGDDCNLNLVTIRCPRNPVCLQIACSHVRCDKPASLLGCTGETVVSRAVAIVSVFQAGIRIDSAFNFGSCVHGNVLLLRHKKKIGFYLVDGVNSNTKVVYLSIITYLCKFIKLRLYCMLIDY